MIQNAILRTPPSSAPKGLTSVKDEIADPTLLRSQHSYYLEVLQRLGLILEILPPLEQYPDSYFVEDTAIILPELIVLCNPGAQQRRGEVNHILPILQKYRPCKAIVDPGTVDGGDVIVAGDELFVGHSSRTNRDGIDQLIKHVSPLGYKVTEIPVKDGLHLKSFANYLGNGVMITTDQYAAFFQQFKVITTASGEEYSANCLNINDNLLFPEGYPKTAGKLKKAGFKLLAMNVSEIRKMDGGLTCLSLRF